MKSLILALILVSGLTYAQVPGEGDPRNDGRPGLGQNDGRPDFELERRVDRLEALVQQLDNRVRYLERGGGVVVPPPPPPPIYNAKVSCLLTDTFNGGNHLGTATSPLDAEMNARQICENVINNSFYNERCTTPAVRCSAPNSNVTDGYECVLVNTFNSGISKAIGDNLIEAEAKVKQACQAQINNSFYNDRCNQGQLRCQRRQ